MRWDLAPRGKTRKGSAGDAGSGFDFGSDEGAGTSGGLFDTGAELGGAGSGEASPEGGRGEHGSDGSVLDKGSHWDDDENPHPTLNQANAGSGSPGYSNQEIFSQRGGGLVKQEVYTGMEDNEVSQTISWREYKGLSCGRDGLTSPAVVEKPVPYSIMPMNSGKDFKGREVDVSQPVMTQPMGGNQGGDFIVDPMPFDETQITHPENRSNPQPGDPSGTLSADARPPTIAFQSNANACDAAAAGIDVSPTVRVGTGKAERGDPPAVAYPIHDQATRHAGKRGTKQDGKGNGLGIGADGDPCPTLTAGDNHAVAYPIDMRNAVRDPGKHDEMNRQGVGVGEDGDPSHTITSAFTPAVATATTGDNYANAKEERPTEILRELRRENGEEAFTKWGLAVLHALLEGEILWEQMLRGTPGEQAENIHIDQEQPTGSAIIDSKWTLLGLWRKECPGCPPHRREPNEQLFGELDSIMQDLPHEEAQEESILLSLWKSSEGVRILRQALPKIQEVGRPYDGETQPAQPAFAVRRLTPEEAEALQGFPRSWTEVPYKGKAAKDCPAGPRYKSIGNSFAVPVVHWLGVRIKTAFPDL